jgi:pimeloyl-ACP methyl ester carboxylesterase
MWARAAREIGAAYEKEGSPLQALSHLVPAIPVLHLYAQPQSDDYLNEQQAFAAGHPWLRVRRLNAASHFPMFEVPDEIAASIEQFAA